MVCGTPRGATPAVSWDFGAFCMCMRGGGAHPILGTTAGIHPILRTTAGIHAYKKEPRISSRRFLPTPLSVARVSALSPVCVCVLVVCVCVSGCCVCERVGGVFVCVLVERERERGGGVWACLPARIGMHASESEERCMRARVRRDACERECYYSRITCM